MRDEALIHFHYGPKISAGLLIGRGGVASGELISEAAPYLSPKNPGKSVVGFCACHPDAVDDIVAPPPADWQSWRFQQWDDWFGRINGVFLVDLERLRVVQYPLYSCGSQIVRCDLSALPRRLVAVEDWLEQP
ncbi:MAG: hypothetical protein ACOH12_00015 [Parvibaculaceae bacterium]